MNEKGTFCYGKCVVGFYFDFRGLEMCFVWTAVLWGRDGHGPEMDHETKKHHFCSGVVWFQFCGEKGPVYGDVLKRFEQKRCS